MCSYLQVCHLFGFYSTSHLHCFPLAGSKHLLLSEGKRKYFHQKQLYPKYDAVSKLTFNFFSSIQDLQTQLIESADIQHGYLLSLLGNNFSTTPKCFHIFTKIKQIITFLCFFLICKTVIKEFNLICCCSKEVVSQSSLNYSSFSIYMGRFLSA